MKTIRATTAAALALLAGCFGSNVSAVDLDLALSSQSGAAELIVDSSSVATGGADILVGMLFNENNDVVGRAALMVRGAAVAGQPYNLGLGAALYYAGIDNPSKSVGALALGFSAKYLFPGNTPVTLGADFFYAPDITTFSDGDSLADFRIRIEANVLPSAVAFMGYRLMTTDLIGAPTHDIDDNIHVGIRISF